MDKITKRVTDKLLGKKTPSNCKFVTCKYNQLAPFENAQECVGCEGNYFSGWRPKRGSEQMYREHLPTNGSQL